MNAKTAAPELSTAAAPRAGVGDRVDTRVHISLDVRDVAASVEFYEAFLGTKAHKVRKGYANFDLVEPPLKLAFNERPDVAPREGGRLSHLGFQVATTEQVLAARRRLVEAGLWTFDESGVCCHARQDKVWVKDPDGISWEIYAVTDEMLGAETGQGDQADHVGHAVPAAQTAASPMTACCTSANAAKCC